MLKHLTIQNYALIESLSLDIEPGFSVITGETGAGKSIIMGALSLVLGQRSDVKMVREGALKCVVEALFCIEGYHLEVLFETLGLDYDVECVVRRELLVSGKSRAFINDTPVNLADLKTLTSRLVDIHSQHENLLLNESKFQLDLVDMLAHNEELLKAYSESYVHYQQQTKAYEALKLQAETGTKDRDFAQYQYDKLSSASLVLGEQETLEEELSVLSHMEEIRQELGRAQVRLDEEDNGVMVQLRDAVNALERVGHFMPAAVELGERARSAYIELQDINLAVGVMANDTEYDPLQKNRVEERLDVIYGLEQKYRADNVEALLALQQQYEAQLNIIDSYDERLDSLQLVCSEALKQLQSCADALHKARLSVCDGLSIEMENRLQKLGIQNVRFQVEVSACEFTATGADKVVFLFSANKNAALQPIAQIASGGEIARVMLSLKSLIVTSAAMPTIVFDEIDTGVSGQVAQRMGEMMLEMSAALQVITITHLPQIAAKGNHHFKVYKSDTLDHTETHLVSLSPSERVQEIAEMMSGKNPSDATLRSAHELLEM